VAHWLMKSEADVCSIDRMKEIRRKRWKSVRNYQVRNMIRDEMNTGDLAFFYHSNCNEPGIAGVVRVAGKPYVDDVQFDPESSYYDPKSDPNTPRWLTFDVTYKRKLKRHISLDELKTYSAISHMPVVRRGNRLSITPVFKDDWEFILGLE
jgi:predicted RNA-binding protein with PUA-like domain